MLVVITLILAPRAEWAHSFEAGGGGCLGRESTLRDGNDLTRKAVNADNHRFTHQVNLADRFAAKSHAPDLAFVFKRLNRLDAFRLEVYSPVSDLYGALTADLLPRSL